MAKGYGGGFGGYGGMNMNNLMKQAQKMQREMEEKSKALEEKEYTATAGGGAVQVVLGGNRELKSLTLKPEVVDPDDIEMLQDLVVAAVNEAVRAQAADAQAAMGGLGGFGL